MNTTAQTPVENFILNEYYTRAYNAYRNISFDPEKRAKSIVKDYSEILEEDLNKIADTETKQIYKDRFISKLLAWLDAKSRTVSVMITGPARFPTSRNEKALNSEMKRSQEFTDFRENFFKRLKKQELANRTPEERLADTLKAIRNNIESSFVTIYEIDNGINTYTVRSLIVANLTNRIKTIAKNGNRELSQKVLELIKELNEQYGTKKPILTSRSSVWKLLETTEIHREQKTDFANKENETLEFEGGKVVLNYEENRIQITHDQIPSYETRSQLKKSGFKWSRFNTAWQRQITSSAKYATTQITGVQFN